MFCTSLRRRPSFAPAIPTLQEATGLNLKESQLNTHDLSIRLSAPDRNNPFSDNSTPKLQVLLLSPSCLKDLNSTTERIQHFALLTGHIQHLAIVLLLSPPKDTTFSSAKHQLNPTCPVSNESGVEAYSTLRVHLMNSCQSALSIPFLLLTTLDGLPRLLTKHISNMANVQSRLPVAADSIPTSLNLLSLCTAGPGPLPRGTTYMVSDLFPDLKAIAGAFAQMVRQPDNESSAEHVQVDDASSTPMQGVTVADDGGMAKLRDLRDLVGENTFRDMLDFWKDEYVIE